MTDAALKESEDDQNTYENYLQTPVTWTAFANNERASHSTSAFISPTVIRPNGAAYRSTTGYAIPQTQFAGDNRRIGPDRLSNELEAGEVDEACALQRIRIATSRRIVVQNARLSGEGNYPYKSPRGPSFHKSTRFKASVFGATSSRTAFGLKAVPDVYAVTHYSHNDMVNTGGSYSPRVMSFPAVLTPQQHAPSRVERGQAPDVGSNFREKLFNEGSKPNNAASHPPTVQGSAFLEDTNVDPCGVLWTRDGEKRLLNLHTGEELPFPSGVTKAIPIVRLGE